MIARNRRRERCHLYGKAEKFVGQESLAHFVVYGGRKIHRWLYARLPGVASRSEC